MSERATILSLSCTVLLAVSSLCADEGRIPVSTPLTIAGPGHYVLTRDVTDGTGISIMSDGVVLDLNGHTIDLTDPLASGVSASILSTVDLDAGVTVRNGRIRGGRDGIRLNHPGAGRILIENVEIVGTASDGIWVQTAAEVTIRSCRVRDAGANGIFFQSTLGAVGRGLIEHNIVHNAAWVGLQLSSVQMQVIGNTALDSGQTGMVIVGDGNRVVGNVAHGSGTAGNFDGFLLRGAGNLVQYNVASGNGASGIHLLNASPGNWLRANVAAGNLTDGIAVTGEDSLIERNVAGANGRYGIYTGNDASMRTMVFRDNMLLGNGSGSAGELDPAKLDNQGGNVCGGPCL